MLADCDYIVHCNADDVYSPHMASFVNKQLQENPATLIQCKRKNTTEKIFNEIQTLQDCYNIAEQIKKTKSAAGDFQALCREIFMSLGGYYGLIKNNSIDFNNCKEETALQEDCWLSTRAEKGCFGLNKLSLNGGDEKWLLHLWHPERETKTSWNQKFL